MDHKELQNLIKFISKSEVAEVNYKTDKFELKVKNISSSTQYIQSPVQQVVPQQQNSISQVEVRNSTHTAEVAEEVKGIIIKSPMIGTFYRRPSPDKPIFANVGDEIQKGSVVCIIEAMKLFNEIESEYGGKIVKILVEDATPVEFDQPLFIIEPV